MKNIIVLFLVSLLVSSCGEPKHPIYGKWKLSHVNDSLVIDNPDEILLEFSEDGTIKTTAAGIESSGEFLISKDTTQITVFEEGKMVIEYKLKSLTREELVMEEGYDIVKFKKMDD